MSTQDFIVTPLNTKICCTCAGWEGARVVLDGHCHSLTNAIGYCRNIPDGGKKPIWQLSQKLAPEAACESWQTAR